MKDFFSECNQIRSLVTFEQNPGTISLEKFILMKNRHMKPELLLRIHFFTNIFQGFLRARYENCISRKAQDLFLWT